MHTLKYQDLPQGGFAGLKERKFVTDRRVFRQVSPKAFNGIGDFVYLADANFVPNGETGLHPHKEIDVISVMVEGNVTHAGSLEHGKSLAAGYTQVQRAGGEGFTHNEINPDDTENHMIQLWVLPTKQGEPAGYKVYQPQVGKLQKIYGGSKDQDKTFYSSTAISVANLKSGNTVDHKGEVLGFLSKGEGKLNGETLGARTAFRVDEGVSFTAATDSQLILVYVE